MKKSDKMKRLLSYENFQMRNALRKAIEEALNTKRSKIADPQTGVINVKYQPEKGVGYIETNVTILPTGSNFDEL